MSINGSKKTSKPEFSSWRFNIRFLTILHGIENFQNCHPSDCSMDERERRTVSSTFNKTVQIASVRLNDLKIRISIVDLILCKPRCNKSAKPIFQSVLLTQTLSELWQSLDTTTTITGPYTVLCTWKGDVQSTGVFQQIACGVALVGSHVIRVWPLHLPQWLSWYDIQTILNPLFHTYCDVQEY